MVFSFRESLPMDTNFEVSKVSLPQIPETILFTFFTHLYSITPSQSDQVREF